MAGPTGRPHGPRGWLYAAQSRHGPLGRLGLRADANRQDVEAAHNVLVEFLELAPHKVNSWAAARTADMDEALALLSEPEQRLISASQRASRAQHKLDETPEGHRTAPASLMTLTAPATRKPRRTQMVGAVVLLLVIAVVLGVYYVGKASDVPGTSGAPTGTETTAAAGTATPVDQAKLATLMQKAPPARSAIRGPARAHNAIRARSARHDLAYCTGLAGDAAADSDFDRTCRPHVPSRRVR